MGKIIVICGPTAVGKTEYSLEIARRFNGEILSCDSMQLYKYMDIGSAKPTPEECAAVPHHLVDFVDPAEEFSVADYQRYARAAISDIFSRGKTPVIEGGTGLYLNSILYNMDFGNAPKDEALRRSLEEEAEAKGSEYIHSRLMELDPESAKRIHPNNTKKIIRALEGAMSGNSIADFGKLNARTDEYEPVMIGLTRDREQLYERISLRVDKMIEAGLIQEVRGLLNNGLTEDDISMKGIGYKEIIGFLHGEYSEQEAIDLIKKNTRHLAKRQLTWFRRYDDVKWFDLTNAEETNVLSDIIAYIGSVYA